MADNNPDFDIATLLVHSGERNAVPEGVPVATPIYASATFTYDSMEEVDQVFGGEKQGYIYTRYGNPTVVALAEAVRTAEARPLFRGNGQGRQEKYKYERATVHSLVQ